MKTLDYTKFTDRANILAGLRKEVFPKNKSSWLPDITISRDPGSGGHIVAEMIAKKLKWKLLDKDFLVDLSKQLGIPEKEFADIDEHPRGWWIDMMQSLFNPDYISDVVYLTHLSKLILHVSKDRQVVVVGRGAGHILPADKCLRVKITAPIATRIKNTMKFEGKTRLEAADWVKKVQDKRDKFVRQYFGCNARSIVNYDLIVNTEHLALPAVAQMIIDAYYDKFPEIKRAK